jgi:hypothetical protein
MADTEQIEVAVDQLRCFRGAMFKQFNAEMPHAEIEEPGDMLGQILRLRMVNRVAAIGVDQQRVRTSFPIAKTQFFLQTRSSAEQFPIAPGKRCAIQAMGRMEHGNVAVQNHFQNAGINAARHVGECIVMQIEGGRHALGAFFQQDFHRKIVDGIRRK